jgi:myo-inositol 2-dehydrogenase/D-chiro-inositol 1-dehydrogenase
MAVRVAVIGAGVMGGDHARLFASELSGATLSLVCDASEERARAVGEACGADDIATDPLAVIGRSDIDAVVIASPDETHASLALAAIAAGKPVLCEKPLSPTSEACVEVIKAEVAAGHRFLQLGFMRRFDPSYVQMRFSLVSGELGAGLMMHNFHRNVEAPPSFTGQMAISNSAPHEFDIARYVLRSDLVAISVFQPAGVDAGQVGAPVFMVIETAAGQLVNVEVNNNAAYGYDVRAELVGEKGSVFLTAPVSARFNLGLEAVERYAADWRPRFAEAYRLQNKAWIESIQTGHPSPIAASAWDGLAATRVAEAGVLALCERRRVSIAMPEVPALYSPQS